MEGECVMEGDVCDVCNRAPSAEIETELNVKCKNFK